MNLKKVAPITNGTRHIVKIQKNLLSKNNRLIRSILLKKKKNSGKSSINGRTTVWHKGGGVKKLYRAINFTQSNSNSVVVANCYDPNRNAFITFNFELKKKKFFFNIAPEFILPGVLIQNAKNLAELNLGYRSQIRNIPAGSFIHNLTLNNDLKTKYIRSAGTYGQIVQRSLNWARIKLPSSIIIEVSTNNYATIGRISNELNKQKVKGNAGVNRRLGIRPTVRGIAMNPVDHPHGGRTNGGRLSVSPWGIPTKSKFSLKKKHKHEKINLKRKLYR